MSEAPQLVYCNECGMVKVNIGEIQTQPGDMCGVLDGVTEHLAEPLYCGGELKVLYISHGDLVN